MPIPESGLPLIELSHVDVRIAGQIVLSDIDWRLERGHHWGVVGANGSGKSSLLGLMAGTLWPAPEGGRRRYGFDGVRHTDAVEARRRITLIGPELQDRYRRFGWNFTALDVVLSGVSRTDIPRRHRATAATREAERLLEDFGLAAYAARTFLSLSRGEQRRVLLARAMAFEPEVLLLDEPAAGLDRTARERLDALVTHAGTRAAIVATTHAVEVLPSIATDLLRLEQGRIVERRALASHEATGGAAGAPRAFVTAAPARGARQARAEPAVETATAVRPEGSTPLIEVQGADLWRGTQCVLRDLDWRLEPGQHWLVSGPNGSGKTTFLRLLHGQLRPARGGSIRWPGLGRTRDVWALRRQVALVSPELQADYLFPTTVRDCVASGFDSSHGLTRALVAAEWARVDTLLGRFQLETMAERYCRTLSYGELRRVLIARTLVNAPRVLLLDEPTEGLDPATAAAVFVEIAASVAEGTQLVCASHLDELAEHFTHELRLANGRAAPHALSRADGSA